MEPSDYSGRGGRGGYASSGDLLQELRDERAKVRKLKEWFKHSYEATWEWRQRAIESYQFCGNDQWDPADKARLAADRRPHLVINKVLAPVLFMMGVQRQQRTEVKLLGFESGDLRKADLMQALLKWVGAQSREKEVDSRVFMDKIVTGLGFWKIGLDTSYSAEGEITWERVSPLAVFTDPNWFDNGWKSSRFVMHALWRDLAELSEEFPKKKDDIRRQFGEWISGESPFSSGGSATQARGEEAGDSFASRRMFWDNETQKARVLECWYTETVKVDVAYDKVSGSVETKAEAVDEIKAALEEFPELAQRILITRRPVRRVRVAKLLNEVLLDDDESPYTEPCFPLWPAMGYYFWENPFGLVEVMKDPQREINRRRSSVIEIVRRMPHAGWLNKKVGGAKNEDLAEFAKGSGFVINFDTEMPQQTKPPDLPQTLVYLERAAAQEVRDVVNVNAELTGNSTQRTVSGRAIEARQRGGLTVQEPLLESFENEKQDAVGFCVTLIQQFISLPKAMRILGALATRQPDGPEAAMMPPGQDPGATMELQQMLTKAFSTKFDVTMKSQPWHPSVQAEKWDTMVELLQSPMGQAIPPDVIVEAGKDAGILDENTAQRILANVQQQQQAQAEAAAASSKGMAAAAGGGGGGPPPMGP